MRFVFLWIFLFILEETACFHKCLTDEECVKELNSSYKCHKNSCVHEEVFPLNLKKSVGLMASVVVSGFINAGGIGGSALIIPIYIHAFDFVIKEAVALTKATIFGATFVTFIVNLFKRHPKNPNRPLVDHHITAYLLGLTLSGATVGVILLKQLSPNMILLWMIGYMLYFSYYMMKRAWIYHKNESVELVRQRTEEATLTAAEALGAQQGNRVSLVFVDGTEQRVQPQKPRALNFLQLLGPQLKYLGLSFFSFLLVLAMTFLRGGNGLKSFIGVQNGSAISWLILITGQVVNIVISIVLDWRAGRQFKRESLAIISAVVIPPKSLEQNNTEQQVERKSALEIFKRGLNIFTGGVIYGSVGAGGGIVISIFLLDNGYSPIEASAICSSVVMYTNLSNSIQYLVAGVFTFQTAFILAVFTMIGSYVGNLIIDWLIKKYNRQSILIWIIAAITVISTVLMIALEAREFFEKHKIFDFENLS